LNVFSIPIAAYKAYKMYDDIEWKVTEIEFKAGKSIPSYDVNTYFVGKTKDYVFVSEKGFTVAYPVEQIKAIRRRY
jgi:hypothetical protein